MAWTTPGTAVAGAVLEADFWNSNVRDNLNAIGAWQTWSPTLTNATQGNGTISARYIRAGKTILFAFTFTLGSTSSVSGDLNVTLPVNSRAVGEPYAFFASLFDNGTAVYPGSAFIPTASNDKILIRSLNASSTYLAYTPFSSTIPFTWATGDIISVSGAYESA